MRPPHIPAMRMRKKNSSSVKTVMSMSLPACWKVQSLSYASCGVAVHAVPVKSRKETWAAEKGALEGEAIREKLWVPPRSATTIQGFDRNSASALQHSGVHHGVKRCSSMTEKAVRAICNKKSSPRGRALCVSGVGARITRRGSRR